MLKSWVKYITSNWLNRPKKSHVYIFAKKSTLTNMQNSTKPKNATFGLKSTELQMKVNKSSSNNECSWKGLSSSWRILLILQSVGRSMTWCSCLTSTRSQRRSSEWIGESPNPSNQVWTVSFRLEDWTRFLSKTVSTRRLIEKSGSHLVVAARSKKK